MLLVTVSRLRADGDTRHRNISAGQCSQFVMYMGQFNIASLNTNSVTRFLRSELFVQNL